VSLLINLLMLWTPDNIFSAIMPILCISRIFGLASYSFAGYVRIKNGNVTETKVLKTSKFGITYSIAVLIFYITTFPFFIMWKVSRIYSTFINVSITYIIMDCLSLSLQFLTSVLSICKIALRNRQIIRQIVLEMLQVDVLLGVNSTSSVYKRTVAALLIQVIFWCVSLGILYRFDYELWFNDDMISGLSKYETNSIRLVMVIQFVNFVCYVKNRFKMINSDIIRTFGFCDEMELDGYLVHMSQQDWDVTDGTKSRHADISVTQLKRSDYLNEGLKRHSISSRIHVLRDVHFRLNFMATSINSVYQVPVLFEVMAVLIIIALKFHLGLVTIFFENITDTPVTLFLSLNFWWIVLHLSKLILIVTSCQYATRNSAHTATLVEKLALLKPLHPDALVELQLFSQQLLHHDLVFSPCGFFTLNHSFLNSCVEALITYIIILLQFTQFEKFLN